ncbi:MAG: type II toxin-antitoxin system RelB/DinJ family antitoxin [Legionellales bacterium]|nr:type II toxin-antitoxin system RelB/DinJ family antitoxin [Legionellales bacterium]
MKNSIVRARVNQDLKQDVDHILGDLGLTMSDAINALFKQIKLHNGLPFEIKVPNKVTHKTLQESAKGKNLKSFNSINDLFNDLEN